jgi:hypothetical protein
MAVIVGPVDVVDEGAPERAPAVVAAACSGSGDHLGCHRRIHHCHRWGALGRAPDRCRRLAPLVGAHRRHVRSGSHLWAPPWSHSMAVRSPSGGSTHRWEGSRAVPPPPLHHHLLLLSFSHACVWCDREMGQNVLGLQGKCGRMILIDWSTRATVGWWSMNEASWTGLRPRMDERLAAQVLLAPSSRPWAGSLFQSRAIPNLASRPDRHQFSAGPSWAFGPHYDLGQIFLYQISLRFSASILVFYFFENLKLANGWPN